MKRNKDNVSAPGRYRLRRSSSDKAAAEGDRARTSSPSTAPPQRHVRFRLPSLGGAARLEDGGGSGLASIAGVRAWLLSRSVVTGSARIHDTGRYRHGTLPPTVSSASGAQGPGALLRACRDVDERLFRESLAQADITELNLQDNSGRTALSYAASTGSPSMLEALVDTPGLDVNRADNEGNSPLHFAAQAGHVEAVGLLTSKCPGIELDARNALGFTPLMKAALQGRTKCAKILLSAGASATLRDTGRGLRAEQWARYCGRYVCADMIEKMARHRLLERTTSYGRWGSEPELAARILLNGKMIPTPSSTTTTTNTGGGLKSRIRRVFRTSSSSVTAVLGGSRGHPSSTTDSSKLQHYSLVTQLTTAALCASTPALPDTRSVPPVVKSLLRPLSVPRLHVTLASSATSLNASTSAEASAKQDPKRRPLTATAIASTGVTAAATVATVSKTRKKK